MGCARYACKSFFCATLERMPGSDTVENAALIAALSMVRGGSMPSIRMHSARMPESGMSASFAAASTVGSPISFASSSMPIPARIASAASSRFASILVSRFETMAGGVATGCFAR